MLLAFFFVWLSWGSSLPKQSELEKQFRSHQAEYVELRTMLVEDKLLTVGDYGEDYSRESFIWTSPQEAAIAQDRANSYKTIMSNIDVPRIEMLDNGSISFSMRSWGMANRGWRINLVWSQEKPKNLLPSLDDFSKKSREWEMGYSHLEANWYFCIIW